jgi:hypothetical protein
VASQENLRCVHSPVKTNGTNKVLMRLVQVDPSLEITKTRVVKNIVL